MTVERARAIADAREATGHDPARRVVGGPFFEDLRVGDVAEGAPALTLTEGHAAVHQAIVGDRLRMALDVTLSRRVLRGGGLLAHPGLVCDVAIGQSTLLTQRVIANLFYRGLVLRRAPVIGDTLRTTTEVVALRQNRPREGRAATGLAVLRIRTTDQDERRVLDFWRCAMLPLRDPAGVTEQGDDLDAIPSKLDDATVQDAVAGWDLAAFAAAVPGDHAGALQEGAHWTVEGGDVVSAAPELARLSLNIATAHHDATGTGARRLVYGGHTIGLAASHLTRALPNLITIVAWHECNHLGPVLEGDTLFSNVELERIEPLPGGGALVHLRCRVAAVRDGRPSDVLDWRPVGVMGP
jgi:acyl dehydratase